MSLSYAAHINGDKVYDIATGYWIEAKQEPSATAGKVKWNVYLYDDEGEVAEKYEGADINEADKDKWLFAGFDMNINTTNASWRIFLQSLPSYNIVANKSGTSSTLKQYFSGEQGYAINADYAVIDVQPLAVSDNGTYTAPFSKAYSPVTVDVQEQPWQPLEDGYSNFWFELTNDTLSPWLNFSAKTENAVIDWGDGSGEVALDTLTPTHTYAKAGKYVVKVRGVTGIARQIAADATNYEYFRTLKAVELSTEITAVAGYGFWQCTALEACKIWNDSMTMGTSVFHGCGSLHIVNLPANLTALSGGMFYLCTSLNEITLPSGLTSIGASAFRDTFLKTLVFPATITTISAYAFLYSQTLSTVHMLSTTPPTLGSGVFSGMPSDYIFYVPVGYGETYKAADRWSAYADHILEEGQTPNRAMLSRLAKAVETDTDEDMR
jgi:hypothetical protein